MRLTQMIVAFLMVITATEVAAVEPVNTGLFGNVAIKGYDTVAYFDGAPALGSKKFVHEWRGAVWRFISAANRDRFAADPEALAPRFGGYCAWAVAEGSTAGIDPEA